MKFSDLPLHSWFFLTEDGKFPKYKCGMCSFQGWHITWPNSINPDQEVFEAVWDQQERVYVCKQTENTKEKKQPENGGCYDTGRL